ncbi:MAG: LPS assembly protein LptD [Paracoccus sp. (in: a-proteobacteria)]|uniref:LPS-assembly protein LptD n=1 Tax=Paracoccus sp. TaxID=267 RepID=UPI0026DF1F7A|nr:LPS assembly protein LptD [Paracoccus sp. (in: a-proteobacteria)]MDO5621446.1 LPS assembly protein LptD [Paracoccus sp. (in: a-proteobacteria)]
MSSNPAKRLILASALSLLSLPALAQQEPLVAPEPSTRPGPALAPTLRPGIFSAADGTALSTRPVSVRNIRVPAPAQIDTQGSAATLLADSVRLSGGNDITAEGDVVIWYQGARLVARRIFVDGQTGEMEITGPVHLTQPGKAGTADETTLIADHAQLSADLKTGILRGARMVMARELQMAAQEATRTEGGRITTLNRVVASSCQICADDPTPLWEIRARSITHDAETRQLRFDRPQFRAFGVPVLSLPWLTAPDPTVDRMSGFLRPRIRTTSKLGFGIKQPYFLTLGDHADLTITPYLSASRTRTLDLSYRQAFWNGQMQIDGAYTRDDILPGESRGYLFGAGEWLLPGGYTLGVQVQNASDRAYLLDYDITDADRLWSGVTLDRVTRQRLFWGRVGRYETLRDGEDQATLPSLVGDAEWLRRFQPGRIGGEALLSWSLHSHRRDSDQDIIGSDMSRASVGLDWRRTEVLPGGLVGAAMAGFDADLYQIRQNSQYDRTVTRAFPYVGAELRWPLISSGQRATFMLEPVMQVIWSRHDPRDVPNEDSRLLEFDEGNLLALDRSPGYDRREGGLRTNLGVTWTRIDPSGYSLGLTTGRVFRSSDRDGLGLYGPLSGSRSDWLVAANYSDNRGLAVSNRTLFDDDFKISRNELRLGLMRPDRELSLGYLWIREDADETRLTSVSELSLDGGWQIAEGWWASAATRYDFELDRAARAEIGVAWRNECVSLEASLRRRFTSSDQISPETDFGLTVQLGGFGQSASTGKGTAARRQCLR